MGDRKEGFVKKKQDELQSFTRRQGLPLTVQRSAVMAALAARTDHPTADQIYDEVRTTVKGISRTTVYRILELFVANGIIRKIGSHEAKARFDANADRHHHIECMRCGTLADIGAAQSYEIDLPPLENSGFHITDYTILFQGICNECRNKQSGSP